jgi:hypothetical protein
VLWNKRLTRGFNRRTHWIRLYMYVHTYMHGHDITPHLDLSNIPTCIYMYKYIHIHAHAHVHMPYTCTGIYIYMHMYICHLVLTNIFYKRKCVCNARAEDFGKINSLKIRQRSRNHKTRMDSTLACHQGCQIFLGAIYQKRGKYTNLHYQMALKYTKWP